MSQVTGADRAFLGTALHTPVLGELEVLRNALIVVEEGEEVRDGEGKVMKVCHFEVDEEMLNLDRRAHV